jgi:hypothetical protein
MMPACTSRLAWFVSLACLFLALSQGGVHAVVLDTQGEYHFGPETSRNQACHLAAERAKFNALSLVVGEQITSEEKLTCQQSTGRDTTASCEMNKNTWVFLDGNIRTAEKVSEVFKLLNNLKILIISADQILDLMQYIPSFELFFYRKIQFLYLHSLILLSL